MEGQTNLTFFAKTNVLLFEQYPDSTTVAVLKCGINTDDVLVDERWIIE